MFARADVEKTMSIVRIQSAWGAVKFVYQLFVKWI